MSIAYKHGSKCTRIHVGVTDGSVRFRKLISPSSSDTDAMVMWATAHVHLPSLDSSNARIEIHAELSDTITGCDPAINWITVDDIIILKNGCPREG